jgi:hypothetical protein
MWWQDGHRPTVAIFDQLGIAVYPVWDADAGTTESLPKDNHRLQRLLGAPEDDWPPTTVTRTYACFARNLDATIREEIGEPQFDALLAECQEHFGIAKKGHALKNPAVIHRLVVKAHIQGARTPTLEAILTNAVGLTS